jgi:hypothetical protein
LDRLGRRLRWSKRRRRRRRRRRSRERITVLELERLARHVHLQLLRILLGCLLLGVLGVAHVRERPGAQEGADDRHGEHSAVHTRRTVRVDAWNSAVEFLLLSLLFLRLEFPREAVHRCSGSGA